MKCSIEKTGQILLSWSIWNKYEKKRGKSHENDNPVLHRKRRKIPNAPPHQKAARHQQRQVDWCRWTCRRHGSRPEDCLLREVKEETGLTLTSYQFRGLITFISDEAPEPEEMCLFTADGFTGELIECNEGDLQWMDKKKCLRFRPGKEMPFF